MSKQPMIPIAIPIILYIFLYRCIKALIVAVSSCCNGLYNEKMIEVPTPNSANDNILSIFVNKPFSPKYSIPKKRMNIVLEIN